MASRPRNFVGLLRGRRVYVSEGRSAKAPLAFVVYARVDGERMSLVARVEDREFVDERVWSADSRSWLPAGRPLTAREKAEEHANWWRGVVNKDAEVVAVLPVRQRPSPRRPRTRTGRRAEPAPHDRQQEG